MGLIQRLKARVASLESLWYDFTHGVDTAGCVELSKLTLAGRREDGNHYIPMRPRNLAYILKQLPIRRHSEFTLVDLGSGKGRVLFMAAEFPFHRIEGVEFAQELHRVAGENIARFRPVKGGCKDISSVLMDAGDYQFPPGKLVIILFNSFPASTLNRVLANLRDSLERDRRDAYLVSIYPEPLAPVLQSQPWLIPEQTTARYHLYRCVPR